MPINTASTARTKAKVEMTYGNFSSDRAGPLIKIAELKWLCE